MDADEALRFVETLLSQHNIALNDNQRGVFRGSWQGKSYKDIHQENPDRCSLRHLQNNVAFRLWQRLTDVLGEKVSKDNLRGPIERAWRSQRDDALPLPSVAAQVAEPQSDEFASPFDWERSRRQDWVTPDTAGFCGRGRELDQLEQRIRIDGCRLITLFGIGGMGKTALAVELGQRVWDQFDVRVWRSLREPVTPTERSPLLAELIADLIGYLSDRRKSHSDWAHLLEYLVNHRCLIVLDGVEAALQRGVHDGSYCSGYENYGAFLEQLGRTTHQSCIILTSREEPKEVAALREGTARVHSRVVKGLGDMGGRQLIESKGSFQGSDRDWLLLIRHYDGNPLALHTAAASIRDFFGGEIAAFMEQLRQDSSILSSIRDLLDEHFLRLSPQERLVLRCLTNRDEPVTFQEILLDLSQSISRSQLEEVLRSLRRRSFVEVSDARHVLGRLIRSHIRNEFPLGG